MRGSHWWYNKSFLDYTQPLWGLHNHFKHRDWVILLCYYVSKIGCGSVITKKSVTKSLFQELFLTSLPTIKLCKMQRATSNLAKTLWSTDVCRQKVLQQVQLVKRKPQRYELTGEFVSWRSLFCSSMLFSDVSIQHLGSSLSLHYLAMPSANKGIASW